jgi:hypothetical protein
MRQIFQYHPVVGYQFIPNLKARLDNDEQGYLLRTNGQGFRADREFVQAKAGDAYRILFFGDSFTAGDSVPNRDRYTDQLETLVDGVETYNFGLPGSGTDQQYLLFREVGRAYEHDLVVIGVLVENIRRVTARYRTYLDDAGRERVQAKPYFTLGPADVLELRGVPVPKGALDEGDLPEGERGYLDRGGAFETVRRVVNALGLREQAQKLTRYQPLPAYDDPDGLDWRLLKAILRAWTLACEKPVIICPIPVHQYVEETASSEACQRRFAELSAWPNVHVHDPLPDLRSAPNDERRSYRFARDVHLTKKGHLALARSLAGAIRRVRSGDLHEEIP